MNSAASPQRVLALPGHSLIFKTAAYHKFESDGLEGLKRNSAGVSPVRQQLVRIKRQTPLSNVSSSKSVKPAKPHDNMHPHYSSSDMFELIKQVAGERSSTELKAVERKLLKVGPAMSIEDYEILGTPSIGYKSLGKVRNPVLVKPRKKHQLLLEQDLRRTGAVSSMTPKKSVWNKHPALPIQKGTPVIYTLGRKNWLREHEAEIRVAKLKRAFETHR